MIFPNKNVVKCLLECGIAVNAKNEQGATPLHLSTLPYNYSDWVSTLSVNLFMSVKLM